MENPRHIFIIGAKSVGQYGGFETFLSNLIDAHQKESSVQYHIACKANGEGCMDESRLHGVSHLVRDAAGDVSEFTYKNAHIFKIKCPDIGPAVAIWYDRAAMQYAIRYCEEHGIMQPVFYVLACRIGLFIDGFREQIRALRGCLYLNPDGHEWMRKKWSAPVRAYWKWSEGKMVRAADLVICDSKRIEAYIRKTYRKAEAETVFIPYEADPAPSVLSDEDARFLAWTERFDTAPQGYYLVVGRAVPENNYETIVRAFMKSGTKKKLVFITNKNRKMVAALERKLHFRADARIRFCGPLYNRNLLKKIREQAYGYLHGHEVGGTNPSLLEAMAATELNLLLDTGFNREVAEDAALYWEKDADALAALIDRADAMPREEREALGRKAKARMEDAYSRKLVSDAYLDVWYNSVMNRIRGEKTQP